MFRHDQWNRINEFQDAESDHKAPNGWIRCVVPWISDLFYHRVLRVLAIPSVSETNETEVYLYGRGWNSFAVSPATPRVALRSCCLVVFAFMKSRI